MKYKGIIYYFNFNSLYDLKASYFHLHGKKFMTKDGVEHYIDKIILREKKLLRLKNNLNNI